jgi:transposase InsO family protein/transposase-like protein
MRGKHFPQEFKDMILEQIKTSGKSIAQICRENNLNDKTVHGWTRDKVLEPDDRQNLTSEVTKLKREKQELIDLIGRLTIDVDKLNKKKINCFEINKPPKSERLKLARICLIEYPETNKSLIARVLKLNRTSLYLPSKRDDLDRCHKQEVLSLLSSNPCYGHRRVAIHFKWSNNKARRIMRKFNIYPHYKRPRYIIKKGDLNKPDLHITSKLSNLLKPMIAERQLTKPNQVWSTDFTYLSYYNSFLYLATIIDAFSKDIVGFEISNRHNADLVTKALNMAIKRFGIPDLSHSDQGSEYSSYIYQSYLQQNGIICSMSKKSSPWENGYQESFYGKFKWEMGRLNRFESVELVVEAIYS